jgi:hypothetical protein
MGEPKFKKGEVSATRAYAIADSLKKESGLAGAGSPLSSLNKNSTPADSANAYRAGFARYDAAIANSEKADRIRNAADAAMKAAQSDTGNKTNGFTYKLDK